MDHSNNALREFDPSHRKGETHKEITKPATGIPYAQQEVAILLRNGFPGMRTLAVNQAAYILSTMTFAELLRMSDLVRVLSRGK